MISNKKIEDKANAIIGGGSLTELQITQLSSIPSSFPNSVYSVATVSDLPTALENTGRLVYVVDVNRYYFSNGAEWSQDYDTTLTNLYFLYSWGDNNYGQLGFSPADTDVYTPTEVTNISNWAFVAAGDREDTSFAITSDGVLYAWGLGTLGRLGVGDSLEYSSPVTVIGGITNWSQVSSNDHTLGIADGIAYSWGYNFYGAGGTGNLTTYSSPVTVIGGITNWTKVSAGDRYSLGIAGGIAYAWGYNLYGVLGTGDTVSTSSPVTVIGGITGWTDIDANEDYIGHSLGIAGGIAYAWGYNSYGELGTGDTTQTSSPVTVIGGITDWNQISVAENRSYGITDTGILYAWGLGTAGRLGVGDTASYSSPVTVVGGITNWSQVSAGDSHTMALTTDGVLYGWGTNYPDGELGLGNIAFPYSYSSPVSVPGGQVWSQVTAGISHNLALQIGQKGFNIP